MDTETKVRMRGEGGHTWTFSLPLKGEHLIQYQSGKLVPADEASEEALAACHPAETPVEAPETELPPPDPEEGAQAEKEAAAARAAALDEVTEGTIDLEELFAQVEDEEPPEHVLGHIHVKAALLAVKGIGEKTAQGILTELEIEGDHHLAMLGPDQQAALIEKAAEHTS